MMIKDYYLKLICYGTDQQEQEAIEYALLQGWFKPKYNWQQDESALATALPLLVEKFQQEAAENEATLSQPMQELVEEVLTERLLSDGMTYAFCSKMEN